jgi:pyruvate/2-oxoglutarate/acetoin dehydrogenase E1 component
MKKIAYAQAAAEALLEEFRRNNKLVYLATDLQVELSKEFGEERVRVTPISESAIVGSAIGLAGSGYRAVADIRMATFGFVAMDQIVNQADQVSYVNKNVDRRRDVAGGAAFNLPLCHVHERAGA